ncbi:MAG: hypothetical protein JW934_08420 [Anaerolineae bacterium]|nr:hypothetical protein [Anaerolineae bacterium]
MNRRILVVEPRERRWRLETLHVETLPHDPREDYLALNGETLCQYLLRRDPRSLIVARGPLPFLSGNKASIGYVSPLTGVPHYSFVGGRAAAMVFNLGLDAIWFTENGQTDKSAKQPVYVVVGGRAPNLIVEFKPVESLPQGQRSAFYWLVEHELDGVQHAGSVFTLGEGAYLGYQSANVAVEAIYHAGRGGAGAIFGRFASALVLKADPVGLPEFFAGDPSAFARNPNAEISPLLNRDCARLSDKTGGTIAKLAQTGAVDAQPTLPSHNARKLGYTLADLGGSKILRATRQGKTGCHWCQVDCRHWHWVPADYAPDGKDIFLDDFEPTYAIFAMLGLESSDNSTQAKLNLLADANLRLMQPIEQMGCDVLEVGLALAALFEGVEHGLVPVDDVPKFILDVPKDAGQRLKVAIQAVDLLRSEGARAFPALYAVGDGPQALAARYPSMQDIVFTGGRGTLGNAGHANALWTFMMPFARFFGHYVGQAYKIDEPLPAPGAEQREYEICFERVVDRLLARELFWILANALSQCAFTFVIFSQDGQGERLSDDHLLVRLLGHYGIKTTRTDLEWFAQAFWAQSMAFKAEFGWRPPSAEKIPRRVYEALSLALERPADEVRALMALLIEVWKRKAGEVMRRLGYEPAW